jgi:two-component system phosphate regulon sensor histidine kinase PhoR
MRRDFVANVSHELRTPLTAITGYAETLRDGALRDPTQAKEFVDVIVRHAGRLRALIEDLLDLSSVEQGAARLDIRPAPVREVAAQAESAVRVGADRRRHALVVDVPDGLPPVLADRDRLAQVLINLLDNAIKFTPDGGRITLAARAVGGGAGGGGGASGATASGASAVGGGPGAARVVLTVADNGVGIPPSELGRIFERFYRVDRSRDRREGGTGLGLAIAKHLVQAMGGTITAESRQGEGTRFTVSLPAARA